jgi:hypothetical protein
MTLCADIVVKTEDVSVHVANDKPIMAVISPGTFNLNALFPHYHDILKVTLRSGEAFAIDLWCTVRLS